MGDHHVIGITTPPRPGLQTPPPGRLGQSGRLGPTLTARFGFRERMLALGASLAAMALFLLAAVITGTAVEASDTRSGGLLADDPDSITLLAAGDLGRCDHDAPATVGDYVESRTDATFLALGDLAYPDGTVDDFTRCYEPHFGSARDRTLPVVGNKDYDTEGAAGYVDYFGTAAGNPDELWYSTDLGNWHLVVLNGSCWKVGGCGPDDPQYQWLEQDLAALASIADDTTNPDDTGSNSCIMVAWHEAYFSSGDDHEPAIYMEHYYRLLHEAGADILLTGHAHNYERFAPQDADGASDPTGIHSFVVGTGGADLRPIGEPQPGSLARADGAWGVLELTLSEAAFSWRFVSVAGDHVHDTGAAGCR